MSESKKTSVIIRWILPYVITAVLIAWAGVWAVHKWDDIAASVKISPLHILFLVPFIIISVLIVGVINQLLIVHLGVRLKFSQWASLAFASALMNYILPMRAGMALRAGYLKKCHNFPLSKFAGITAFTYIVTLLSNSAFGAAILVWLWSTQGSGSWPLLGVFVFIMAMAIGALVFSPHARISEHRSKIWDFLTKIHLGWNTLRTSPSIIIKSSTLFIVNTLIFSIRIYIVYKAIGYPISFIGSMLVGTFTAVAMFTGITPASLGIREAAVLFASSVIGVPTEISLLAGAIDRAVSMLIVAILGPIGMLKISHETANT